jgi:hypothetical protein
MVKRGKAKKPENPEREGKAGGGERKKPALS